MNKHYKVTIDFEDIKNNNNLNKLFFDIKEYKELSKNFRKGLLLILLLLAITSVILGFEDRLFSIKGIVDLVFIAIAYYFIYNLFYFLFKFLFFILNKKFLKEHYKYLIGEFEVELKNKELLMTSKWKDITLKLEKCRVKSNKDFMTLIDESGFVVMFPKNKFEDFEGFKEKIISMRRDKNE